MDLTWGSDESFSFARSLGLVSSNGPHGYNVMSCEWTNHVSYSPGLIAIHLGKNKATKENIEKTGFFGISIPTPEHSVMASVAGKNSGRDVDKIAVLKDLGFKFFRAEKIDVLLIEGAVMTVECKVIKIVDLGDHVMFVAEVLAASANKDRFPLIYHKGKYWEVGERITKPDRDYLNRIDQLINKHSKS